MALKSYNPVTPSQRQLVLVDRSTLYKGAPVKTLTELRQWNVAHQRAGSIKYGQALLDISDEMNVETDAARYRADREKDRVAFTASSTPPSSTRPHPRPT